MKKRDGVRDKLWEVVLCQTVPSTQVPGVKSPEEIPTKERGTKGGIKLWKGLVGHREEQSQ